MVYGTEAFYVPCDRGERGDNLVRTAAESALPTDSTWKLLLPRIRFERIQSESFLNNRSIAGEWGMRSSFCFSITRSKQCLKKTVNSSEHFHFLLLLLFWKAPVWIFSFDQTNQQKIEQICLLALTNLALGGNCDFSSKLLKIHLEKLRLIIILIISRWADSEQTLSRRLMIPRRLRSFYQIWAAVI